MWLSLTLGGCSLGSASTSSRDAGLEAGPAGDGDTERPGRDGREPSPPRDASALRDAGDQVDELLLEVEGQCGPAENLSVHTIEVEGEGLQAVEGRAVHVFTEWWLGGGGECGAHAVTRVEDGAFRVEVANLRDGVAYPIVAVWIDEDGDQRCELESDLVFRTISIALDAKRDHEKLLREDFDGSSDLNGARELGCEPFRPCGARGRAVIDGPGCDSADP